MEFSYCTEFNTLVHKSDGKIELSVFHLNMRSLNKNWKGLKHSIELDFDVLVLSEVWNYNLDFYNNIFKHLSSDLVLPDSALKNGRIWISGLVLQTTSFMQSIQQLANASAIISLPGGMR